MKRNKWARKALAGALSAAMIASMSSVAAFAETPAPNEARQIPMTSVSIGGVNYFYVDASDVTEEDTEFVATVRSRSGSTDYTYKKSELTQVGDTNYYYAVPTGTA